MSNKREDSRQSNDDTRKSMREVIAEANLTEPQERTLSQVAKEVGAAMRKLFGESKKIKTRLEKLEAQGDQNALLEPFLEAAMQAGLTQEQAATYISGAITLALFSGVTREGKPTQWGSDDKKPRAEAPQKDHLSDPNPGKLLAQTNKEDRRKLLLKYGAIVEDLGQIMLDVAKDLREMSANSTMDSFLPDTAGSGKFPELIQKYATKAESLGMTKEDANAFATSTLFYTYTELAQKFAKKNSRDRD